MPSCAVLGCTTRKKDKTVSPPITLHQFPSDEEENRKWIVAVNRKNWKPSKRSYVCSKHFTEDCFDRSEFYSKLNKGAIPSIFDSYPKRLKNKVLQDLDPLGINTSAEKPIDCNQLKQEATDFEDIEQLTQEQETPSAKQSVQPPLKKKKRNPNDTVEELLGLAADYFSKPESELEVLAKGWAIKLSKLALDQRLYAEKIINDTLFEAQMGALTRNGVRFLPAPESDWHQPSS